MTGRNVGYAALVAAAVCWGSTVVLIEVAARGLSVASITIAEIVVAAVALGAALLRRRTTRRPPLTGRIALAGALEPGIAYVCINTGIANTSGTHAALLLGTESVFVVLLSAVRTRQLPAPLMSVGLLIALCGAGLLANSSGHGATLRGDLLVLVGAVAAAMYVVLIQPVSGTIDAIDLTSYQFLIGSLVTVPVALIAAGGATLGSDPRVAYWAAAVLAGLLGSVAAFALYNWALPRASAGAVGGSLTMIPVFGVVFSVIFLDDTLGVRNLVAAAAALSGLALITLSDSKAPTRTESLAGVV